MDIRNFISPLSKKNSDEVYWRARGIDGRDYIIHKNNQDTVLGKCVSGTDHSTEEVCEIIMFKWSP